MISTLRPPCESAFTVKSPVCIGIERPASTAFRRSVSFAGVFRRPELTDSVICPMTRVPASATTRSLTTSGPSRIPVKLSPCCELPLLSVSFSRILTVARDCAEASEQSATAAKNITNNKCFVLIKCL